MDTKHFGGLAALGVALYLKDICTGWNVIALIFGVWTLLGGHHTLYVLYHTLWRDLK